MFWQIRSAALRSVVKMNLEGGGQRAAWWGITAAGKECRVPSAVVKMNLQGSGQRGGHYGHGEGRMGCRGVTLPGSSSPRHSALGTRWEGRMGCHGVTLPWATKGSGSSGVGGVEGGGYGRWEGERRRCRAIGMW